MSVANNVKHLYKKMYPFMTMGEIQNSIYEFDKVSIENKISLESSNRHKYLRGWLMKEHELFKIKRSKTNQTV